MKALVVFGDADGHPLARFMKPGFRHCFCCVLSNGLWLQIDGCEGVPEVKYLVDDSFDLVGFYRGHGYTVVETEQRTSAVTWPLAWRNCVGVVKAVLCIRSRALTPYGLYRYLTRNT